MENFQWDQLIIRLCQIWAVIYFAHYLTNLNDEVKSLRNTVREMSNDINTLGMTCAALINIVDPKKSEAPEDEESK